MASQMSMASLELVPAETPNSQRVAVMDKPGYLSIKHALIPEPADNEIRIKVHYNGALSTR